jgi:hypothetical protein
MSGVKKQLNELKSWTKWWNRKVGEKEAFKIIPLRRTGYLTVRRLLSQLTWHHTDCPCSSTSRCQTSTSAPTTARFSDQTHEKMSSATTSARRTKTTGTTSSPRLHDRSTPCRPLWRASRRTHQFRVEVKRYSGDSYLRLMRPQLSVFCGISVYLRAASWSRLELPC